ncbi:hypothetical protein [Nonomuraea gerenzanensis]|uniref:Uncharacterized protein n=1 Tax=Nonomuraea gerenzanensis TaxID=93944 RepID=A0A1M4DZ81_9ACTN|nr:hypothetical protein [Nonomuraea gerenzanensis]UBU14165.1 hypothetical protein LCN96_03780 [Nonomuraea gerenzanensis]SBO91857.1 hypothetical protein BN4615_P1371 [Nonomuraea gerenzanensis]
MLKNHLRRDLQWLKRQARKDRRITVGLLAGLLGAWVHQVPAAGEVSSSPVLLVISAVLAVGSGAAWLLSAYLVSRTLRVRREPAEELRWIARIGQGKEWAFCSLSAYVAWHLLQFVTALLLG